MPPIISLGTPWLAHYNAAIRAMPPPQRVVCEKHVRNTVTPPFKTTMSQVHRKLRCGWAMQDALRRGQSHTVRENDEQTCACT